MAARSSVTMLHLVSLRPPGRALGSSPQLLRCELGAFGGASELHPHDRRSTCSRPAGCRSTVDAGDDVLAAGRAHARCGPPPARDARRSSRSRSITPGMMILLSGSFTSRQTFHSCPWRGLAPGNDTACGRPMSTMSTMSLSGTSLWCALGRRPADVHAHALGRDVADSVVERSDMGGDHLAEFREAQMREHHVPAEREIRAVELQHEAGIDDGAGIRAITSASA